MKGNALSIVVIPGQCPIYIRSWWNALLLLHVLSPVRRCNLLDSSSTLLSQVERIPISQPLQEHSISKITYVRVFVKLLLITRENSRAKQSSQQERDRIVYHKSLDPAVAHQKNPPRQAVAGNRPVLGLLVAAHRCKNKSHNVVPS